MQLDPQKYNKGMISAFRQVVSTEGAGALATGPLTLTLAPPQNQIQHNATGWRKK
jgi:hypothetical protein